LTYTDVEALMARRFPLVVPEDDEVPASHQISWQSPSFLDYLSPRPMAKNVGCMATFGHRAESFLLHQYFILKHIDSTEGDNWVEFQKATNTSGGRFQILYGSGFLFNGQTGY